MIADARRSAKPTRERPLEPAQMRAIFRAMHEIPVVIQTSLGSIRLLLDFQHAPLSVDNFLEYVDRQHYDGTIFHRVIKGFMAQGGGFDAAYQKRAVGAPIANEAHNGLKNVRGTVAMARTSDPGSATAQFFINVVDNPFLDHKGTAPHEYGYAVFGRVVEGMDVVDRIRAVPTGARGPFTKDAPLEPVVIESIRRG